MTIERLNQEAAGLPVETPEQHAAAEFARYIGAAFREGWRAYEAGLPLKQAPAGYVLSRLEGWRAGWLSAREHAEAAAGDEAVAYG